MSDVFTQAKRSEVMSRIRSRGNRGTEGVLVAWFRAGRITGWRRQREIRVAGVPAGKGVGNRRARGGKRAPAVFRVRPDFVFPRLKVAVFVDGCFWHGCPRHATQPRNNAAFWEQKLAANRARDRRVDRVLRGAGWRVLRIWEHALKAREQARTLARVRRLLAEAGAG